MRYSLLGIPPLASIDKLLWMKEEEQTFDSGERRIPRVGTFLIVAVITSLSGTIFVNEFLGLSGCLLTAAIAVTTTLGVTAVKSVVLPE